MNKTHLFVRLSFAVLSAGLVSCAKDETKIRDNYKAPPPIINTRGSEDLKTWDRRSQKSLDLQDSFDVSAGAPARLEVTTRCQFGTTSLTEAFFLVPNGPVKLFQVLPADLLTRDLKNEKFSCGFELALQNAVGSKHIFMIAPVPLTDDTGGAVKLEKTGNLEPVSKVFTGTLEGLRIRYRNTAAASAEIHCDDMNLPAMPFEQVTEFSNFDFSRPELRAGRLPKSLIENHQQVCRVLLRQSGNLHQLSDRFTVQLPLPPLLISSSVLTPEVTQRLNLALGSAVETGVVIVQNPLPSGQRHLRISKSGQSSVIRLLYPPVEGHINARRPAAMAEYSRLWTYLLPRGTADIPVFDRGDHFFVTIPGGKAVPFAVRVQPPGRMHCNGGTLSLPSQNITVRAKVQIQEVDARGEWLANLPEQVIDGVYLAVPPDRIPFLPAPVPGPCGW